MKLTNGRNKRNWINYIRQNKRNRQDEWNRQKNEIEKNMKEAERKKKVESIKQTECESLIWYSLGSWFSAKMKFKMSFKLHIMDGACGCWISIGYVDIRIFLSWIYKDLQSSCRFSYVVFVPRKLLYSV